MGLAAAPEDPWLELAFEAGLFAVYLAAVWKLGVLTPQERSELTGMASSLRAALQRRAPAVANGAPRDG